MSEKGTGEKDKKILFSYVGLIFVVVMWGLAPIITVELYDYYSSSISSAITSFVSATCILIYSRKKLKLLNADYFKPAITFGFFLAGANLSQKVKDFEYVFYQTIVGGCFYLVSSNDIKSIKDIDNTEFTAQVYSLESKITINDPAGVIIKEPTFTLYINNKVSTRRTYYQSSDVVITGLSSETEYVIVGTYTYMDSDWETKKIVTFYMGTVHTKDRSSLGKIDISFENGQIYPRKMELKNLKVKSALNSEAIRGVKKVGIRVEGQTFILNTKLIQALLKGERVTVTSTDILKSNRIVPYEILLLDEVIFIDKGKIILTSPADELRNKENSSIDEIFRRCFKC